MKMKFFAAPAVRRISRFLFCLGALLAFQPRSFAEVTKLPTNDQSALRNVSHFSVIRAASALPPSIFALCADHAGRFAEPEQAWEVTDVITDDKLPTKRMIWAVTDGDYYVVHYERGGYAHSFHVLVAKQRTGESHPRFVWYGVGKRMPSFNDFLASMAEGRLDDRLEYGH